MSYIIWMEKYRTGLKEDDPVAWNVKTITEARKIAYKAISHTKGSLNEKGEYKANIYEQTYRGHGPEIFVGEVMNTVSNKRYWYPWSISAGKYELRPDGRTGKKLR